MVQLTTFLKKWLNIMTKLILGKIFMAKPTTWLN